jgi:hypothetical protein
MIGRSEVLDPRLRAWQHDGQQFLSWPSGACEGPAAFGGCLRRELFGRQVAQARMRTFAIVLDVVFLSSGISIIS